MYAADQQKKAANKGAKRAGQISAQERMDRDRYSQMAGAEGQLAREQLRSSEAARGLVMGQLGAPGTYGSDTAGSGSFQVNLGGAGNAFGSSPGGLYGEKTLSGVAEGGKYNRKTGQTSGEWEVTGTVDDPFETATRITNQAQFSAVSALVGEAVQLGNREGEMWDNLTNSSIGGVMAGAARQQRAAMEMISRSMARGGSARRAGLAIAQKMAVTEQNNKMLTDGLWKARNDLEAVRSSTIQNNINFANAWVDNQSGIRDSYTQALASLRTHWTGIVPALLGANSSSAGAAFKANIGATDALMTSQTTKANAIASAAQYLGGALQNQVGIWKDKQDANQTPAGAATGNAAAQYGPNPTSADYGN
jgi:hypothetical protein